MEETVLSLKRRPFPEDVREDSILTCDMHGPVPVLQA